MKKNLMTITILLLLMASIRCSDNDYLPPPNPNESILGKWILLKRVDSPWIPQGYNEFLPNGVYRFYDFKTKSIVYSQYIITDNDILHVVLDNIENTVGKEFLSGNSFLFFYKDKMNIHPSDMMIISIDRTYKRIK